MNIIIRTFEGFEEILVEEVFHITEIKPEIGKGLFISKEI